MVFCRYRGGISSGKDGQEMGSIFPNLEIDPILFGHPFPMAVENSAEFAEMYKDTFLAYGQDGSLMIKN